MHIGALTETDRFVSDTVDLGRPSRKPAALSALCPCNSCPVKVKAVETRLHPNGSRSYPSWIENDGGTVRMSPNRMISHPSANEERIECIRSAVSSATAAQHSPRTSKISPASAVRYGIINAAECEPVHNQPPPAARASGGRHLS